MKLKKLGIFLYIFLFLINSIIAAPFIEGEHYMTLNKPIYGIPKVVEFFSFLCPHCYQFESLFHQKINISSQSQIKTFKYHIAISSNEELLTKVWSIAIALGIEKQTILPIYNTIINNKILSYNTFCKIFTNLGISKRNYDYLWNSYTIRLLTVKQQQSAKRIGVIQVPTIVVNGKYIIKNDMIKNLQEYNKIISYLYNLH
ncbi:MAG: DsbA family protein [Candidatus Dasytiphilus stammeri]